MMKHRDPKLLSKLSGFSLIEVIIALAIVVTVGTSIMSLGTSLLQTSNRSTAKWEHGIEIGCALVQAHKQEFFKDTNQHALESSLRSAITYQAHKIDGASKLKDIPSLVREEIDLSWSDAWRKRNIKIIAFKYVQPPQEQKS